MAQNNAPPGSGLFGFIGDLWEDIRLAWRLLLDPEVPLYLKALPVAGLLYVVSPIDFIMDWIPVLGQMDDIAIIAASLGAFIKLAPPDRVAYHRAQLEGGAVEEERTIDGSYKS